MMKKSKKDVSKDCAEHSKNELLQSFSEIDKALKKMRVKLERLSEIHRGVTSIQEPDDVNNWEETDRRTKNFLSDVEEHAIPEALGNLVKMRDTLIEMEEKMDKESVGDTSSMLKLLKALTQIATTSLDLVIHKKDLLRNLNQATNIKYQEWKMRTRKDQQLGKKR